MVVVSVRVMLGVMVRVKISFRVVIRVRTIRLGLTKAPKTEPRHGANLLSYRGGASGRRAISRGRAVLRKIMG